MKKNLIFILLITLVLCQDGKELAKGSNSLERNIGTCSRFTSDRESCLECVPHYHLFEGQCFVDINGCKEYVFGNICRSCQSGYILVNNECCDKNCMARIFKSYEAAAEHSELTDEQKVQKRITEGYEKTVEALTVFRYQFSKFSLQSTSNQVLQGYVRYFIKILANQKPYRCVADFEIDTKKIFVLEFRLESEMSSIKQVILSQQDMISNQQARAALQYSSAKFGLKTYGASLQRVSVTYYKYAFEFKLIYLSSESALIVHIIVPTANKKQSPYSPWSEQRKDVQTIKTIVQKSMAVVKMQSKPQLEIIKQKISETTQTLPAQVEIKTIQKVRDNVYKYTYVNEQTKQIYEQVAKIDSKTKSIEVVQQKEVIPKDIQNIKLPEAPEKKIITKQQATQTTQIKQAIKYLEEVQPSLANKQIVNAAIETYDDNQKITLIQKKNEQVSRVVLINNQKTNEYKLIDESPVITTPPTQTVYTTTPEGKPKIFTTDVEKIRKIDNQTDTILTQVESKLSFVNTSKIVSFEKTEGNKVNTYQLVVNGEKPESPKQQVTVVQNTETQKVKVIDVKQIPTPVFVEPIKKQPTPIPETEYKTTEVKTIVQQYTKTIPELKNTQVVIKKAQVEQAKFVNQYTVVVETKSGETVTIKANKPHDEPQPVIISVKPLPTEEKPQPEQPKPEQPYIKRVEVNELTGVKTTTSTKVEDIKTSLTTQVLQTITVTQTQPKVEQIQSVVRKDYEKTIVETSVIKQKETYVQVTVEQNKTTGQIKKVSEQVVRPVVDETKPAEPVLPVTTTTHISSTTFSTVTQSSPVLQSVTQTLVQYKPILKDVTPTTTEVEERGPVQVVTFVYENKVTKQKNRVVAEYVKETQKTVIKEETVLPKVIEKQTFEKTTTVTGDTKIVSTSIEEIKKEDKDITTVIKQVSQQIPLVKENPVQYEVISNPLSNTYQFTTVEPTTKQTVTVTASYDKQTKKVTLNDIQESPRQQLVAPKPLPKPVIVLSPVETAKPEVQDVMKFIQKTVNITDVKEIKQVKNTLTTCYDIITQTPQGDKTVTVAVNNSNTKDITLVDVLEPQIISLPTPEHLLNTPLYTTNSVDSANVKTIVTSDKKLINSNKYVKLVSSKADKKFENLISLNTVECYFGQTFDKNVEITYLSRTSSGNLLVSGFVNTQSEEVNVIEVPTAHPTSGGFTISSYSSCVELSNSITSLSSSDIETLQTTDRRISSMVSFINSNYSPKTINRVFVQSFTNYIRYVIVITVKTTVYRVVILYNVQNNKYEEVEGLVVIDGSAKPTVVQYTVETDGTKITTSNSIQEIKTTDKSVEKFVEILNQQVPVKPSQITNIVSKQSTNTNEYTITVKTTENVINEIKAIYKKDDNTVIVADVKEQPKPLITFTKPVQTVSKEEYTSTIITKSIEEINKNPKIPNITSEKIVEISKTVTPLTTNYEIVTQTIKGEEKFTVSTTSNGEVTVLDYKPAKPIEPTKAPIIKTEYVVNPVTGVETLTTTDIKTIKESKPIQNVVTKITSEQIISKHSQVVSAVTKTSQNKVQTTVVMKSPETPKQNVVVVAVVDKKTEQVQIIEKKVVPVVQEKPVKVEEQIPEIVYTPTMIQNTIKEDKVIQNIVKQVTTLHSQVKQSVPTQITTQKIGTKTISTVTYQNFTSTVVHDEKTNKVEEIHSQKVPTNIKPLVYETHKTSEGTVITTNSVQKIRDVNKNFSSIVTQIKQKIPTIQTQKIEGVRYVKGETPEAPQKFNIVFDSEKTNELSQISVVFNPVTKVTTILDVQSTSKDQIIPVPQKVTPVVLNTQEIKESKIYETISSQISSLPIKTVQNVISAQQIKTTNSKIYEVQVQDTNGDKYIIKTEQSGAKQPQILDYVKVPEVKKQEIVTVTTTNSKNGIVSTTTNDIKIMQEEKTFQKVVDAIDNKKNLTKNGFVIASETVSRFQRTIEYNIRFINKETSEIADFRAIIDSRTGQVTINDETRSTLMSETDITKPVEKQYIEITRSMFTDAFAKYNFLKNCLDILVKADFTFQGKTPNNTQIKQYNNAQNGGVNAVQVVMIFQMTVNGVNKNARVVFYGEEKQSNKGHIMKIIDITTMPETIPNIITKVTEDAYGRKTTFTSDVKTLKQTNQEYNQVIEQLTTQIPSLTTGDISNVQISEMKNANDYTVVYKQEKEVVELKVIYHKRTQEVVISDIKTQNTKVQFDKLPFKESKTIEYVVPKQNLAKPQYQNVKQQIITQQSTLKDVEITNVKVEQRPKVDTYIVEVVDKTNTKSIVQVLKNADDTLTVIGVKPVEPTTPQKPQKEITTEVYVDSVTGSQVLTTNDEKTIKESSVVQSVITNLINTKSVSKNVEVVNVITKTSEKNVETTLFVKEPHKPQQHKVVVTIVDKKNYTNIQPVAEQVVYEPVPVSPTSEIVKPVVINKNLFESVIKQDTELQTTIKTVETKHTQFKGVKPTQVTTQHIGNTVISEVVYETKKVTVVSNTDQSKPVKIIEQPLPSVIVPSKVQTTISVDGTKTVTSNSVVIMEQTQPQFKVVLPSITKDVKKEEIQTVSTQQTTFGQIVTVVSQTSQDITPRQTTYFYNKQTEVVTKMGTQQVTIDQVKQATQEPVKETKQVIQQTKWSTPIVKSVIEKVNTVVTSESVTKVEQIESTPVIKIYQVTVDTNKGSQVIKTTVNQQTNEVTIIEQKPLVAPKPETPQQPTTTQAPSETKVTVDSVTGVKTTYTTDSTVIEQSEDTQTSIMSVVTQIEELEEVEVIQVVTKQYTTVIEHRIVFAPTKQSTTGTQVITTTNKDDKTVKVISQSSVDTSRTIMNTETILTNSTISQVAEQDDVLKKAIKFVATTYTQFLSVKPSSINVDNIFSSDKYTFIYVVDNTKYRVVVLYSKESKHFTILEEPNQIDYKPIVFDTTKTSNGRTNYYTNDVETLTKHDTHFSTVVSKLSDQFSIDTAQIVGIQSHQTSLGSTYTIMSVDSTSQTTQFEVIYNQDTKQVKVSGIESVPKSTPEPVVRPTTILTSSEYDSDDIKEIIKQSKTQGIPEFTTTQITQVKKTTSLFSTTYEIQISSSEVKRTESSEKPEVKAYLTASISINKSSETLNARQVTIISYRQMMSKPRPQHPTTQMPSTTSYKFDTVTGSQIKVTNNQIIIKQDKVIQNVVEKLTTTGTFKPTTEVVSTVTKTSGNNINTVMVVKTSETQYNTVVTVTNKDTEEVTVIAESPVPQQIIESQTFTTITEVVPQTVITSTTYDEVIKKDVILQTVVEKVIEKHPEVKQTKPTQVITQKVGTNTVTEVTYKNVTVTVVHEQKTGKVEEVYSAPIPKELPQKPYVLEQTVTEEGFKIVTSNTIQNIEKVVPTVRPAITEVVKVVPIKTEEIKTITTSVEENKYTVVTVDKTGKTKEVVFTYTPEAPKPVQLIDVQEYTKSEIIIAPTQIVFETVVEEQPQITKTIKELNETSSTIKNDVTKIVKVEKSVTNFAQTYKVQVQTHTEEQATIVLDVNPDTKQTKVVDVIKYQPQAQAPKPIIVQQTINPITQTRQTVFTDVTTYKQDVTYNQVTSYLQDKIPVGYEIASVVKENYGDNQQINILLKGQDKSPQQIELNINNFNNEVTVFNNKTIVSKVEEQFTIVSQDQPKPTELKLSPIDQEKFDIISKLSNAKPSEDYKTVSDVKSVEKNELFMKADSFLKTQFESVLQQSNIVYVSEKKTLDTEEYVVSYVGTQDNTKEIYQANVKLNPVLQTFEVTKFSKIGDTTVEKSNLNIASDIAYGYETIQKFSSDKNVEFVVTQLKKHYSILESAVIQSVEVLSLCNKRYNYRIYFKNGLEISKYIVYFEQAFQRVVFLAGKQFSLGGNYQSINKQELVNEGFFRNVDQAVKQKNSELTEGAEVLHAEREDRGNQYGYRVIYSKNGKTFHAKTSIDKDNLKARILEYNQIIEVPIIQPNEQLATHAKGTILKINDLAHNSNFEKVHREILAQEGSSLQSAQLVGAHQKCEPFKNNYIVYFRLGSGDSVKVSAQIDATTKQVTILGQLQKISLENGFTIDSNDQESQQVITWAQKNNPDLKSAVVVEISNKKEIFGKMFRIVFKLHTKYYKMTIYKEGSDLKVLSQSESTSLDSATPSVRTFPKPSGRKDIQLNKK